MAFQHLSEFSQKSIGHDHIDVFVMELSLPDNDLTELESLLSPEELERADRFVFRHDRNRYIAARGKLRQLLAEQLEMAPQLMQFNYGPSGKPSLATQPDGKDLRFNISHSGDLAVFVLADGLDVGVDVEAVKPLDDRDLVAQHCFSTTEQQAYFALNDAERTQGFFNCWTRKEALVKAMGDGLNFPLDEFDVTLVPGEPAKILSLGSLAGSICGWEMDAFSPMPGYVAAAVIEKSNCQRMI